MKKVRYGVIGCGAIAQRRHLPEANANPHAQIVAVSDPNKERARDVAAIYNATPYTDHKKLLAKEQLDAVVVCTPNALHAPVTIDAFKAGLHVLVEKPMASTREEAKKMIAAAKKAKKYLMIGMNQRLMAPHVKAKEILDSGRIGKPISFESTFKHGGPDGWSVDGAASWFFDKRKAVMGVTGDLGVHKVDLMRFLLGDEFAQVGGFVTTLDKLDHKSGKLIQLDDNAYLTLKSRGGVIGAIAISWTHYGRSEDNGTTIYCTKGCLKIGRDPEFGVIAEFNDGTREYHKVGAIATNVRQVSSGVIDSFTDCILHKHKPVIDGDEGYRALNIILTAMDAAKSGKMEKIRN